MSIGVLKCKMILTKLDKGKWDLPSADLSDIVNGLDKMRVAKHKVQLFWVIDLVG